MNGEVLVLVGGCLELSTAGFPYAPFTAALRQLVREAGAAELFISAKTASVHVSNILAKLGVSSRGEAAATAHRLRLT